MKSLPKMRDLCNESRSVWIEARTLEKQGKQADAAAKDKASRAKQKEAEVRESERIICIEPAMFGMPAFVRFRIIIMATTLTQTVELRRTKFLASA